MGFPEKIQTAPVAIIMAMGKTRPNKLQIFAKKLEAFMPNKFKKVMIQNAAKIKIIKNNLDSAQVGKNK
jgi:hypothetical protein